MPKFEKPDEGSWTEHYPGLGTAPVSYEDSISPEFFDLEREAIFRKTWLNIGRVEQIPRTGNYFTREIETLKQSIIVSRDGEGKVNAFYNVCRHRGNKLVWDDYPKEETSGTCRQFTCKYHAWRFNLDGSLAFVQQEQEFFDLDKDSLGLVRVICEVWEGFIFVNFAKEPEQSLIEFLGEMGTALGGYPFGEMTERYSFKSEIGANWKLFIDAFVEFYHAPVLHQKQSTAEEAAKLIKVGFEGLFYKLMSPHSMVSSWGGMAPPKDEMMVKPMERALRSGLFGPWDAPNVVAELPQGVNPSGHKAWGIDSFIVFPNFMVLIWERQWYMTYHYWPLAANKHLFEVSLHFVPPKTPLDRIRQELTVATTKEFALQDANTLEATQTMLETRVVDTFVLNDQEILCRHHHAAVREFVRAHQDGTPVNFPWANVPASV